MNLNQGTKWQKASRRLSEQHFKKGNRNLRHVLPTMLVVSSAKIYKWEK